MNNRKSKPLRRRSIQEINAALEDEGSEIGFEAAGSKGNDQIRIVDYSNGSEAEDVSDEIFEGSYTLPDDLEPILNGKVVTVEDKDLEEAVEGHEEIGEVVKGLDSTKLGDSLYVGDEGEGHVYRIVPDRIRSPQGEVFVRAECVGVCSPYEEIKEDLGFSGVLTYTLNEDPDMATYDPEKGFVSSPGSYVE